MKKPQATHESSDIESELRQLALIGARQRIAELEAERERLLTMFPEIAGRKYKPRVGPIAEASGPLVLFDAKEHAPKPRLVKPRIDDKTRSAIVADLKAGHYMADVARKYSASPGLISGIAKTHKIRIRKMSLEERQTRGVAALKAKREQAPSEGLRRQWSKEEKAKAVARVKAGEYMQSVARSLGMHETLIRRWCDAAGVKPTLMPATERGKLGSAHGHLGGKHGKKGGRPSPAANKNARDEIIRRVTAGEGPTAVAKELGVNPMTVKGWFAPSKGAKAGTVAKPLHAKFPEEIRNKVIDRVKAGESGTAIAREMGIVVSTVRGWLSDAGVHSKRSAPNGVHKEA